VGSDAGDGSVNQELLWRTGRRLGLVDLVPLERGVEWYQCVGCCEPSKRKRQDDCRRSQPGVGLDIGFHFALILCGFPGRKFGLGPSVGGLPDPACPVAFGPFEFDVVSAQLRKHGHVLRLPGQSLQILSVLVDRPGQIVSRDELRQQLWGAVAFGDFEQGLNFAVNKLRQTLGDSAGQPRYIETVPGRGYRFVAPIQRASRRPVLGMTAPATLRIEPKTKIRWQRRLLVGTAVGLALVARAGYWMGKRSQEPLALPKALTLAVVRW
jgi:DNA-binding winged helix-turn-helix (wHTH) protein